MHFKVSFCKNGHIKYFLFFLKVCSKFGLYDLTCFLHRKKKGFKNMNRTTTAISFLYTFVCYANKLLCFKLKCARSFFEFWKVWTRHLSYSYSTNYQLLERKHTQLWIHNRSFTFSFPFCFYLKLPHRKSNLEPALVK